MSVNRNSLDLNFSELYFGNFRLHLGSRLEHFHLFNVLGRIVDENYTRIKDKLYINYQLDGVYDNLNTTYFPSSGQYFSFRYSVNTDNFLKLDNDSPLSILEMNFYKPVYLADGIYITPPRVTSRYIMNDSVPPLMYRNFVGGRFDDHYLPHQISLQGSSGMEILDNMVFSADIMGHYNFKPNNYLYANVNYTVHNNHVYNLFDGKSYFGGVNLGYSYLSIVGPLRVEFGYSGLSRKFHPPFLSLGYYL